MLRPRAGGNARARAWECDGSPVAERIEEKGMKWSGGAPGPIGTIKSTHRCLARDTSFPVVDGLEQLVRRVDGRAVDAIRVLLDARLYSFAAIETSRISDAG